MELQNEVWQKIPGTDSSWIYPLIRKPSITGSNTFIIRSGNHLLVIDPGAIADQMEKTLALLSQEIAVKTHPIIIIAGHIHIDHTYLGLVERRLRNIGKVVIAAEAGGALHLEEGNYYWTGADVAGVPIPRTHIDIPLLAPGDLADGNIRRFAIGGADDLVLITKVFEYDGNRYYGQSFSLDQTDRIEFWHSPGHSDDSLTIRIGSLFHIGDIPFAISPGIAGRPGYDRDALIRSVIGIRYLFEHEGGRICCPGHGTALNREATLRMLNRLEQDARAMPEVCVFDATRIDLSMWHGLDLVEEAYRLFPVIAGRMMFLSYQLEELGMEEEADQVRSLFDYETVDSFLDDFTRFYEEYKQGKKIKPEVVNKALQIFARIQSAFPAGSLSDIIDLSLVRRADRLFSDFMGTIHGIIPKGSPRVTQIIPLIRECISNPESAGISDSELLFISDNEDEFRKAMVQRLAHYSHQRKLRFDLQDPDSAQQVRICADQERFRDFFAGLCEYFEEISARSVEVSFIMEPETIQIYFTPQGDAIRYEIRIPGATLREAAYAGGRVLSVMEPGKEDIRISFPVIS
jgi:glyoxylase-like metal-dependent hydrolase (beta-lactamase superfamily II)